jgi:hypothetical protein
MPSSIPIYPLRLDAEVRGRAEARAKRLGVTLNAYISMAVDGLNKAIPPVRHRSEYGLQKVAAVAAFQSKNSLCSCGSGLKFKRCCGQ